MADTVVQELVINTLTQAQFDAAKEAGTLSPYELYGTPDTSVRLPVLTPMWFDHITNDMSWLRADTFSWQSGDVYKAAYEHLAEEYASVSEWSSETVGGVEIYYKLMPDGHKITNAAYEQYVQAIYEATGVAWYYILDIENKRFKLPRTKWGFTGLRDSVGGYVAPGLPDHTHNTPYGKNDSGDHHAEGTNKPHISTNEHFTTIRGYSKPSTLASASNAIYGNSDTVQPPATQMYLYFFVGNFEQSAVEQTAGLNAELFNGKADVDLNNINPSNSAKATIISYGIPDYTSRTTISGNEFVAPCAGLVMFEAGATTQNGGGGSIRVNGASVDYMSTTNCTVVTRKFAWVDEDDVVSFTNGAQGNSKIFFPLKGTK